MKQLTDAEEALMDIIWDNNKIRSGMLVEICREKFDWKKSTTYTILHHLEEKEMARNTDAVVSWTVSRDEYLYQQEKNLLRKYFNGSLPSFVAAFSREKKLSKEDVRELEKIIESYK